MSDRDLLPEAAPGVTGMRARIARFSGAKTNPVLENFFRTVKSHYPKADLGLLERAYQTAAKMHGEQKRKSGEPYITHPLAVSQILAELGMDVPTLVAALLHDTVEDTSYTLAQLRREFGDEVALLVDGVTKIDNVQYRETAAAETIRKMVIAMSQDIRVLVIKLADRLHNMRTIGYVKLESQQRKARETLDIFAPLAHRLGMNGIKWELEDLGFATLHPKVYDEIVRLVAKRAPEREAFINKVISQVEADLKTAKIKATVTGRPKHYYSIYQKMLHRHHEFEEIYDLVGVRVLVTEEEDCYRVLGRLHNRWTPLPNRFKDYISHPKMNNYQSLHTTLLGPDAKPVEMQIRTIEMHQQAEFGVAAHWRYKESVRSGISTKPKVAKTLELPWVQQLLDVQDEFGDPSEFLDSLRYEINSKQVYVFTPRGEVKQLPKGATPVDFAYTIHTEVGNKTIGARVNNKLVPLDTKLDNNDIVEIFTSKSPTAGPSRDWLNFAASPRARSKIRHWFSLERREESIELGKDRIAKLLRKEGMPLRRVLNQESLTNIAVEFKLADVDALYAAVGEGQLTAQNVVRKVVALHEAAAGVDDDLAEAISITNTRRRKFKIQDSGVFVPGVSDVLVKLAKCCTPVPGDEIFGFVTRGSGVSVHRIDCTNSAELTSQPERLIQVQWQASSQATFLVQVMVEAIDRPRLLIDITLALAEHHINILAANLNTNRERLAKAKFTFELGDAAHLHAILHSVRNIPGVLDAYRVTH